MREDAELLRLFAENGDEGAFQELVRRHLDFVYASALRQVNGDQHLARDVAQVVFIDVARKARSLTRHRVLAGWLFTSTRFAAAKFVRTEQRRRARELEAHMRHVMANDPVPNVDWALVRLTLDAALSDLSVADRDAILLRYFEKRDYREIGGRLQVADNTARMRVDRALDALRAGLERRGITSTTVALAAGLAAEAAVAAPAGWVGTVTSAALASSGSVGLWAAFMSMTKLQIGIAGALAVAGAAGLVSQARTNDGLRAEVVALERDTAAIPQLRQDNISLGRVLTEVTTLRASSADLSQLSTEVSQLRTRMDSVARAQAAASAPIDTGTYSMGELDQVPNPVRRTPPKYPEELRKAGVTGEVLVEFVVERSGDVKDAKAVSSSRTEFEAPAVEAVSAWKFDPGRKDGRAVNTRLQVPIVFSLSGESSKSGSRAAEPDHVNQAGG